MQTIYLERSGGTWEASWWHFDEGRYFRCRSDDSATAVRNLARQCGIEEYRVVRT